MQTEIEVTKMSSKGQLVLPKNVRAKMRIKKGTLFVLKVRGTAILLKAVKNPILEKDIELLQSAEKGWKEIEEGKARKMGKDAFLKELAAW